jgi:hypothetical protein
MASVAGPHFESLCRTWAAETGQEVFGDLPAEVSAGAVTDPDGTLDTDSRTSNGTPILLTATASAIRDMRLSASSIWARVSPPTTLAASGTYCHVQSLMQ